MEQEREQNTEKTGYRFDFRYRIDLEDYLRFNFLLSDTTLDKRRRRSMIMGGIEIVFAVIFLAALVSKPNDPNFWLYLILDALVLVFGLYTVLFYKVIFPRQLTKSATKQYNKNQYLRQEIGVTMYDDRVEEVSGDYENEVSWKEILEFRVSETLLLIMLDENRCILVPKSQIQGQMKALKEFLNEICRKYEKRIVKAQEKTKPVKSKK